MRRTSLLFLAFGLSLCLMGCGTTTQIVRSITVAVSPTTASVGVRQTQQFTATVAGTTNTAVTWSAAGGAANGTITASGFTPLLPVCLPRRRCTSTKVNWTLTQGGTARSPACGTIAPACTTSGVAAIYTAPATLPALPTVTVTAPNYATAKP